MTQQKKYITVFTVAQAAIKNGVNNPHQLHTLTGISVPKVNKLWWNNRKGKIDLEMLDLVCDALKCRLYEIIKRIPESELERYTIPKVKKKGKGKTIGKTDE